MVRRDHIPQHRQNASIFHIADLVGLGAHALEKRRVLHIGRRRGPVVSLTIGRLDPLPLLVARKNLGIFRLKSFARDGRFDQFRDFLVRGPDIFQEHIPTICPLPQGFA